MSRSLAVGILTFFLLARAFGFQEPNKTGLSKPAALEVLVLGSGGPRAFGRGATSYAVLVDGVPRILVDAGPGTFSEIGRLRLDLNRLDTVLITHLHIDHSADLPALILARSLTSKAPIQFKVFGPQAGPGFPSTTDFLRLLFDPGGAFEYERTFGARESISGTDLNTNLDAPEKMIIDADGLQVKEIATHHGDAPAVAYRIDYRSESVTFSGDMDVAALRNLETLAAGSSLLIFNCAVLDPPGSPAELYKRHTPPQKIGEAARDAHVLDLLLSHIPPAVDDHKEEVLISIHKSYNGPVAFAADSMTVPVLARAAQSRAR
jgi:ribonuclease BN (tRNA processing enzyme)